MTRTQRSRIGPAAIILFLIALAMLSIMATRKNKTLVPGQTVQFDDFAFTVVEAAPNSLTGEYMVRIRVDNRAKRVSYRFQGDSFALVDSTKGEPFHRPVRERTPAGKTLPPQTHELQAGESATVDYVFSLPPDMKSPTLRILSGGRVGDLLEWAVFGRKVFQLP